MIFVTVGTHEQSFNRLIKKVDELIREKKINEEVFIQIGFSTYEPQHCEWERIINYDKMLSYLKKADTIITHGGPSTYMQALHLNKQPIVVPRQRKFHEHINDHQFEVSQQVRDKGYPIILCEDIQDLEFCIKKTKTEKKKSIITHNKKFMEDFNKIINLLDIRK